MSTGHGAHRIGEFARRVGVSPELLRAWEQRYHLLDPVRSPGGFRLYGEADAARVARMRRALEDGLSAAQAAQVALAGEIVAGETIELPGRLDEARTRLLAALEAYDEATAQAVLDDCLATFGLEIVVRDLILSVLSELGRRWTAGQAEVSHEHFASNLLRGRLLSLARLWGRGNGPLAMLACAPGERHDISLIAFGLLLRSHGWRILFLGADTPLPTLTHAAQTTSPAAIVIVAFVPERLEVEAGTLRRLSRIAPVFLSGPGASGVPPRGRVQHLASDVSSAAAELARFAGA
jgi:DNA-binding transcriptional MerR regulator